MMILAVTVTVFACLCILPGSKLAHALQVEKLQVGVKVWNIMIVHLGVHELHYIRL